MKYWSFRRLKALPIWVSCRGQAVFEDPSNENRDSCGTSAAGCLVFRWKDMTEIGALVCEAILNFDEDGEEQAEITSPTSLRNLVGWVSC